MGIAEVRNAFNEVAQPIFSCTKALMRNEPDAGVEWQVITFYGTANDGAPFEVASTRHHPGDDPNAVAAETAKSFLNTQPQG